MASHLQKGHKKSVLGFCCCFLLAGSFAFAKVHVGEMIITPNASLEKAGNEQKTGIKVEIKNLSVSGYKDQKLMFCVQAYADKVEGIPNDLLNVYVEHETAQWDSLIFEIKNSDLKNYLGAGKHTFYVIFMIIPINSGSEMTPIKESYIPRKVTLTLTGDEKDDFTFDHEANDKIINEKAPQNRGYKALAACAQKYDLAFFIRPFHMQAFSNWMTCSFFSDNDDANEDDLTDFCNEFNKYPIDLIKKFNIKGLALINSIGTKSYTPNGTAGGTLDLDNGILFIVLRMGGKALHHEMFHFIEFKETMRSLAGKQANENKSRWEVLHKSDWVALNAPGTKYREGIGSNGGSGDTLFSPGVDHPAPGFITDYAMQNQAEDRAEVFAHLLTKTIYNSTLQPWVDKDKYLKQKVDYIIQFVHRHWPGFSASFLEKMHK